METALLFQHGGFASLRPSRRPAFQLPVAHSSASRLPVLMTAAGSCTDSDGSRAPAPEKRVYDDNWFDRLAISYMTSSLQSVIGVKKLKDGYEGLVEAAVIISGRNAAGEQQQMVIDALSSAFPANLLSMARTVVPPSKFSRELFAVFTTLFFPWMVGPCEVIASDFQGQKENNVVYIRKCRFLEATNCVGMCTNLCKLPSQKFIINSLGMPTYMVPNFEDQSCQIIFGQHPPADDPALKQPCYQTSCLVK